MSDDAQFRNELVEAGLLIPMGTDADGVYARSAVYEDVVAAVDRVATETAAGEHCQVMRFPPVMPRDVFERTGYLSSFPDLMGSVATFIGDNADHRKLMDVVQAGGEWTELLKPAGVILCPAACQQLYSTLTGTLPEGGSRYDVSAWCYRHEPSMYAARHAVLPDARDGVRRRRGARRGRSAINGWSRESSFSPRSAWKWTPSSPMTPSSAGSARCWPRTRRRRR